MRTTPKNKIFIFRTLILLSSLVANIKLDYLNVNVELSEWKHLNKSFYKIVKDWIRIFYNDVNNAVGIKFQTFSSACINNYTSN